MKKLIYLLLLAGNVTFAQEMENRNVSDFKEIKVSQSIAVNFIQSNNKSVEVLVQNPEDLQYVKTEVVNGVLQIYVDLPKKIFKKGLNNIKVQVSNPVLEGVTISSSSTFNLTNEIVSKKFRIKSSSSSKYTGALVKTDNLEIESSSSSIVNGTFQVMNETSFLASSSSKIILNLKTKQLNGKSSSSSKILLSGSANQASVVSSSSSKIEGSSFSVVNLTCTASSSSMISIDVTDSITATVSSSAKVLYKGKPSTINASTSSSGVVAKL